jgi:hypothetical protein
MFAKRRGGRGFVLRESMRRQFWDGGVAVCAQGVHRKCRKAVACGQWLVVSLACWLCGEPREQAWFEPCWTCADGSP